MTTIKKLTAMPYAQAHVEIDTDGNISLFSYVTKVAEIDTDNFLSVYGLYSMTTRKHISAFMREYTPFDFSLAKSLVEFGEGAKVNLETGELIGVED